MTKNVANNVANEKVQDYVKKSHNMTENKQKSEKNLTEQWKKGELEQGWYYVLRNNDIEMLEYIGDYFLSVDVPLIDDKDVGTLEILAPVPSWEKYERILVENDSLIQIRDELDCAVTQLREDKIDLIEENDKLKELLKECVEVLNDAQRNYGYDDSIVEILEPVTTKIDEALQ